MEDNRAYACAYRFVSARCLLLQFAATTIRVICSALQVCTACFSSSSRTFNPKVAGSNPARPWRFAGKLRTTRPSAWTDARTSARTRSPAAARRVQDVFRLLQLASACPRGFQSPGRWQSRSRSYDRVARPVAPSVGFPPLPLNGRRSSQGLLIPSGRKSHARAKPKRAVPRVPPFGNSPQLLG
jgi:hypothetical protein